MVQLRSADGEIIDIEDRHAIKCCLIKNIKEMTKGGEMIVLQVDSEIMKIIHRFMKIDNYNLTPGYNCLEIYFSNEHLSFFEGMSHATILKICNAANYLEYLFLLELCCKVIANTLADNSRSELAQMIGGTEKLDKMATKELKQEFDWLNGQI